MSNAAPAPITLLLERARALEDQGRYGEAKQAYLELLSRDPRHLGALQKLSSLSEGLGLHAAAMTTLWRAILVAIEGGGADPDPAAAAARERCEERLRRNPHDPGAHHGLALALLQLGDLEGAQEHACQGHRGGAEESPYRGAGSPIRLLVVKSATGGNTPIEPFFDDRVFLRWTIFPERFDAAAPLPPHDLAVNCIGDADRCGRALRAAAAIFARTDAPVLNAPERVLRTARVANARRLGRIPGVVTARVRGFPRGALAGAKAAARLAKAGLGWPLLLRSPGFHTGLHFAKVEGPEALPGALEALPGTELLAMQYLETRSADGCFRKYRVMAIDGQLHPLHLAVASG